MKSRRLFLPFLAVALILVATGVLAQEEDDVVVPGAPTNVRVSVVGTGGLQIQWDPPEEDQEAVTGYEIFRSHVPNGLYRKIVHVPRNVLSYRDDTIRPNLRYFYRVRTEAVYSFSDYSSPACAEPSEHHNQK